MDININQVLGADVEVDDNDIAYVALRVTDETGDEVTLRMNAAQGGITAAALRNAETQAEDALKDAGELGKRTLDAISPNYSVDNPVLNE